MLEDAVTNGYVRKKDAVVWDKPGMGRGALVYRRTEKYLVFEEWLPAYQRRKAIERENPPVQGSGSR
jgi:predicted ArsR family transcriptional regulator